MIYHKGRWLIEPEIKALLSKLEDMNEELRSEADRVLRENTVLREKQESADRQIAEYKRLLKSAISEWNFVCEWGDCRSNCEWYENGKCTQEWSGKAEALALIGEDGETNEG